MFVLSSLKYLHSDKQVDPNIFCEKHIKHLAAYQSKETIIMVG